MRLRRPHAALTRRTLRRRRRRAPHRSVASTIRCAAAAPIGGSRLTSSVRSSSSVESSRSCGPRSPAGTTTGRGSSGTASSSWDGCASPTSSSTTRPRTRRCLEGRSAEERSVVRCLRDCSACLVDGLLDAMDPLTGSAMNSLADPWPVARRHPGRGEPGTGGATDRLSPHGRSGWATRGWSRWRGDGRPGGCPDRCPTLHPGRPVVAGSTT